VLLTESEPCSLERSSAIVAPLAARIAVRGFFGCRAAVHTSGARRGAGGTSKETRVDVEIRLEHPRIGR
jgi:hypothetical protein